MSKASELISLLGKKDTRWTAFLKDGTEVVSVHGDDEDEARGAVGHQLFLTGKRKLRDKWEKDGKIIKPYKK